MMSQAWQPIQGYVARVSQKACSIKRPARSAPWNNNQDLLEHGRGRCCIRPQPSLEALNCFLQQYSAQ